MLAGSVLISFTTPITFYCYMRMVQGFDDSGYDLTGLGLITVLERLLLRSANGRPDLPVKPTVVFLLHTGTTTWSLLRLTTTASRGRTCRCPSPFSPPW
jgi:hypothetical protein